MATKARERRINRRLPYQTMTQGIRKQRECSAVPKVGNGQVQHTQGNLLYRKPKALPVDQSATSHSIAHLQQKKTDDRTAPSLLAGG